MYGGRAFLGFYKGGDLERTKDLVVRGAKSQAM